MRMLAFCNHYFVIFVASNKQLSPQLQAGMPHGFGQSQIPPYGSLPPQHHLAHPQQQQTSPSQPASELRAVLNQPSKLVQQQQLLQQQHTSQPSSQPLNAMASHIAAQQSQGQIRSPTPHRPDIPNMVHFVKLITYSNSRPLIQ